MTPRLARRGAGGRGRHCSCHHGATSARARGRAKPHAKHPRRPRGNRFPIQPTITQSEHLSASQQRETAVEIAVETGIISDTHHWVPTKGSTGMESEHERDT